MTMDYSAFEWRVGTKFDPSLAPERRAVCAVVPGRAYERIGVMADEQLAAQVVEDHNMRLGLVRGPSQVR